MTVAAPIPLQVVERGQVIGTSEAARIMLPAGRHDLRLVNSGLEGFVRAAALEARNSAHHT